MNCILIVALLTVFVAGCSTPQPGEVGAATDVKCEVGFQTGSAIAVKRCLTAEQAEEQRKQAAQIRSAIQDVQKATTTREGGK